MARREWADKKAREVIANIQSGGYPSSGAPPHIAKALRAEHARAVRIARQVVKHAAHMEQQTRVNKEANAYWQGKLDGAENILTSLQKGRA